jgi:sugar phosphate isomerase/epimerase
MKTALSGFLFEDNYTSQSVDLPGFLALARGAGYDGVELRETQVKPEASAALKREIREQARAQGLEIVCLTARHLPAAGQERDDYFQAYLELCRDLDCRLLKIVSDIAWLKEAAGRAAACGVGLAANNHVGGRLETTAGTRAFFAELGHPNFGLLYDSMHLSLSGQDYLGFIPEVFSLTRNILVHSLRPAAPAEPAAITHAGKKWRPALPDEPGAQPDWAGIFKRFKALGYDGWVTVIENGWAMERRTEVARHCAAAIRRLWI